MNFRTPINLDTDDYMDVGEARTVASDFHGGQTSPLYSFASTGKLYLPNTSYINELKNVSDESLQGYSDAQDAITDKYRLIEFFKVQPETAITENAKYAKFTAFLESVKEFDPSLVESIKEGFNICMEAYEDVYTPEDDTPSYSAMAAEGSMGGSYKYEEPLDIYADTENGQVSFKVYTDGGDLLHDTSDIKDAFKFVKDTENTVGHKPTKSYGNRWLNRGDKYTIEDLVYIMDSNGGRKPMGLSNVSDEDIQAARSRIK